MTGGRLLGLAALLAFGGCRGLATTGAREPAVLIAPGPDARAELNDAITLELHRASPVLLSDDALTRTNVLTLERVMPRDAAGRPYDGRQSGRPERFSLWRIGDRCELEHEGGARLTLKRARCGSLPH